MNYRVICSFGINLDLYILGNSIQYTRSLTC
nr:MAG TPA: hypothetical protein [Caudoviricetes sp.]